MNNNASSTTDKITLLRSFFRGRDDVIHGVLKIVKQINRVMHRYAVMNGLNEFVKNPKLNAQIVATNGYYLPLMKSSAGIF